MPNNFDFGSNVEVNHSFVLDNQDEIVLDIDINDEGFFYATNN